MAAFIVPAARAVVLCESYLRHHDGKVDLQGVFNSIDSVGGFPYVHARFCAFAQLVNGLGNVPFFIDIRRAGDQRLIWTGHRRILHFPSREIVVQVANRIDGCRFEQPGDYLLELYCDNNWVCDTKFAVR